MYNLPETAILFASDRHGVYIPQHFAESVNRGKLSGVSDDDMNILLAGPDHPEYWDAWDVVEQSAILTDSDGTTYGLYQDGDLWLIPTDFQFDDMDGDLV